MQLFSPQFGARTGAVQLPQVAPQHAHSTTALARLGHSYSQPALSPREGTKRDPAPREKGFLHREGCQGCCSGRSTGHLSPTHPPVLAPSAVPKTNLPSKLLKYQENESEIQLGTGQGDELRCHPLQTKHLGLLEQSQPQRHSQGTLGLG